MVSPNKARVYRRRPPTQLERKSRNIDRNRQGGSRARGSRVGDELVAAFEEMAKHLRGEIELEAHELPGGALTPPDKGRPLEGCLSTKEFERLFWIPARTMESYEQGRRNLEAPCVRFCASSIASRRLLVARSHASLYLALCGQRHAYRTNRAMLSSMSTTSIVFMGGQIRWADCALRIVSHAQRHANYFSTLKGQLQ